MDQMCIWVRRNVISVGAVFGLLSVALGAFGTHGLKGSIGYDLLEIYETANRYLALHALAIMAYGIWLKTVSSDAEFKPWPASMMMFGTFIFCGSLYLITFTVIRQFGMVAPIGGIFLMIGWLGFAIQARKYS